MTRRFEPHRPFELKRILFPIDFSERCRRGGVRRGLGRTVRGGTDSSAFGRARRVQPHAGRGASIGPKQILEFFGPDLKYFRTESLVLYGEAAHRIVECAAERHADLIMLPTRGLGMYRRLIIGSNVDKVLHDAD